MYSTSVNVFGLATDRFLNGLAQRMRSRVHAGNKSQLARIVVPLDDIIGIRLFSTGMFEQTQIDGIVDHIRNANYGDDAVFVDVGANIGIYSMRLSSLFAHQYAIEANPTTFRILETNMELTQNTNTTCVNVALSDKTEDAFVFVPENGNLGWATLNAEHHDIPVRRTAIHCDTLDNVAARQGFSDSNVRLIKIDVEGHEFNVLRGAKALIAASRPALLCEILGSGYGKPMVDLLLEYGYKNFYVFKRRWAFRSKRDWASLFNFGVEKQKLDPSEIHHHPLVLAEF